MWYHKSAGSLFGGNPGAERRPDLVKFQIDTDVMAQVVECEERFSCLSGDLDCFCQAKIYASEEILFVESAAKSTCKYQLPFGHIQFCTCPVRKEIYKCYKV
jgi:hypothetical protein